MGKFNQPHTNQDATENYAGGEAYAVTPKFELASILLTSFVKDQFYRSSDETVESLIKSIEKIQDKTFVAKAALYARTKYGMRSISHITAAELAHMVKGEEWTKRFFDKIVYRPDDMGEILAYYSKKYGEKKIPNAIKKGFASAIESMSEYNLAKYRKDGAEYSMVDIVNLVHPKSTPAIGKLMKGTLQPAETWETKLTQAGQKAETEEQKEELKKDAWRDLITTRKIGYFALLRNLRNILEQAPELTDDACALLTDATLIQKSLVLPFRFPTAYKEIESLSGVDTQKVRKVLVALNTATDLAMVNVPKFDGTTLVVLDESGSMGEMDNPSSPISIGSLFAAILIKSNNADFMGFSDDAAYRNINPSDSTLTIRNIIEKGRVNGGTNFHAIFNEASKLYDRIIILSDMQGWVGYDAPTKDFASYKKRTGAKPYIYSFDLQGYGTIQFPKEQVFCIAGFSDKIFSVMKMLEQDRETLIKEIEAIHL